MKLIIIILVCTFAVIGCKKYALKLTNEGNIAMSEIAPQKQTLLQEIQYKSYGKKITSRDLMTVTSVKKHYKNLKTGDTTSVKFKAPINTVCKSKGCWMRLDLGDEEQVFVKFKNYAFFVPTDASGEAIVQGKAFVEEISVVEQQHLALDTGMSADDIAAIIKPKRELILMAEGVLME